MNLSETNSKNEISIKHISRYFYENLKIIPVPTECLIYSMSFLFGCHLGFFEAYLQNSKPNFMTKSFMGFRNVQ